MPKAKSVCVTNRGANTVSVIATAANTVQMVRLVSNVLPKRSSQSGVNYPYNPWKQESQMKSTVLEFPYVSVRTGLCYNIGIKWPEDGGKRELFHGA
jgi:hypothetical protein